MELGQTWWLMAQRDIWLLQVVKPPPQINESEVTLTSPDLDVQFRLALDDWDAGTERYLICKYGGADARSWFIKLGTDNKPNIGWSEDGTNITNSKTQHALDTSAFVDGQAYWFRITVDVDNGSGKFTVNGYNSTDGVTWIQTDTYDGAATTSFFDSNTAYSLGGIVSATSTDGKFYEVRICDGIGGDNVLPQPIEAWEQTVGDAVWGGVVGGYPTIYVYNAGIGGASTWSHTAILSKTIKRCQDPIVFICLGHNDNVITGPTYLTQFKNLIDGIKTYAPYPNICLVTQNSRISPADYLLCHSKRKDLQVTYAQNNNIEVIDGCASFLLDGRGVAALLNPDGVHPNTDGQAVLADAVWQYFNVRGL